MKSAEKPAVESSWENPLIPNKKLRQLYTAMAELRLLYRSVKGRGRSHAPVPMGYEAILASTVLSLTPGDLTSSNNFSTAISFLRPAGPGGLTSAATPDKSQLPAPEDPASRLHIALGAALGFAKRPSVVLAYVDPEELPVSRWKALFRLASAHTAPVFFVALPSREKSAFNPGRLGEIATASGVPGIPVDKTDAVALYRVAQESLLRARAGGGPALMECIAFQMPGRKAPPVDPVRTMRESLLRRRVADEAWFDSVASRFSARSNAS